MKSERKTSAQIIQKPNDTSKGIIKPCQLLAATERNKTSNTLANRMKLKTIDTNAKSYV
jgi:hypothetical protein